MFFVLYNLVLWSHVSSDSLHLFQVLSGNSIYADGLASIVLTQENLLLIRNLLMQAVIHNVDLMGNEIVVQIMLPILVQENSNHR